MKRFYTIFLAIASVALLASCEGLNELPEFEESESFAAFPQASFAIDENGGQLIIPVQIAVFKPVATQVSYKIVDGTAKAGVDFKDTNASAVLSFDGKSLQQNIVIDIIERSGEFTGDLNFSIELLSASGLKLSEEKVCAVRINDLDHPLAAILGSYTVVCNDYWLGNGYSYTLELLKDPTDVSVVWTRGLLPVMTGRDFGSVYANVSKDDDGKFVISFPCGQVLNDVGYGDEYLYGATLDGGSVYFDDSGNIVFNQTATGFICNNAENVGMCIYDGSFWQGGLLLGPITWTKN